jgi:hypothetical protein
VEELKIRVNYVKGDEVRFLSHLDLARTIRMALRRAKWPIVVTGGFSPKMRVSFYSPLPVGTAGYDEYMDVVLGLPTSVSEEWFRTEGGVSLVHEFLSRLTLSFSESLPLGIFVKEVFLAPKDEKPFESRIARSLYEARTRGVDEKALSLAIDNFLASPTVSYDIHGPKGTRTMDLRRFVESAQVQPSANPETGVVCLSMGIKHVDGRTARPQWVVGSLSEFGLKIDPREIIVNRLEIVLDRY